MNLYPYSPSISFDIFHSVILPEVILDYIHSVLVTGEDLQWNALVVLPMVCTDFNRSCRSFYRIMFGLGEGEYTYDKIQNVYCRAKDSWLRARGLIKDSEDDLIVRYRDLMANQSLIQIYLCLATTFLPDGLKPVESLLGAKASSDEADLQSYSKMQDEKMHRLFMPLTCAIKLCDTVPPKLAQNIARYIANIGPYCATVPVLLKYTQDLQSYLTQEYPVPQEVQGQWVFQTLSIISQVDNFLQRFGAAGRIVPSIAEFDVVPKHIYEIVDLPRVLEKVAQYDWGSDLPRIRDTANAITTKIDMLC